MLKDNILLPHKKGCFDGFLSWSCVGVNQMIREASYSLKAQSAEIDSTIYSFWYLRFQGIRFAAFVTTRGCFILNAKDTIVKHLGNDFISMTLTDFNHDGYPGILIEKVGNTPGAFELRTLPVSAMEGYKNKWGLIKQYWYRKYQAFF